MIKPHPALREFEQAYAARLETDMSLQQAMRIFEELWSQARALGSADTGDWRTDLEPDIEMAQTLKRLRTINRA